MMEFEQICIASWLFVWASLVGYLLSAKKVTERGTSFLLVCAGIFLVLVLHGHTVSSIAVSWKEVMALKVEVNEKKEQVFAEARAVKELGEQVAKFAAHTVATNNRWVEEDYQNRMLEEREGIRTMMKSLGSTPDRIEETLSEIDKMVEFDLKHKVVAIVEGNVKPNQKGSERLLEELQERLNKYDTATHDSLVAFLKKHNRYDSSVEKAIQRLGFFLINKRL